MSSAKTSQEKEPATLQSTRQMLDELDALMDRMLALPVNDVDESAPPPPDIVRMPTMSATLTVVQSPMEEANAPVEEEETPMPVNRPHLRETMLIYTTDPAVTPPEFDPDSPFYRPRSLKNQLVPNTIPDESMPPSIMGLSAPVSKTDFKKKTKAGTTKSPGNGLLSPLVWFNQAFDLTTVLLGQPGQWLRGSRGRNLLGWSGLVLLAASGAWLVKDWLQGWTW